MSKLATFGDYLVLAANEAVFFLNTNGDAKQRIVSVNLEAIATKPPQGEKEDKEKNQQAASKVITALQVTDTLGMLAITTEDKSLYTYNIEMDGDELTLKLLGTRTTARALGCLSFAPKNRFLLVCDKSGDCYTYDCTEHEQPGKWVFGHMSQILDALIDDSERFIITCDRDEKIKVTSYPDCHNIVTFCLAHSAFVAGIRFVSPQRLLSVSGDKTLRVWDFVKGEELTSGSLPGPAVEITSRNLTPATILCAIRCYEEDSIRSYQVTASEDEQATYKQLDTIELPPSLTFLTMILDPQFNLVILAKEKETNAMQVLVYSFCPNNLKFSVHDDHVLVGAFKELSPLIVKRPVDYSQLFKKHFDNLTDYYERKKQKIESK